MLRLRFDERLIAARAELARARFATSGTPSHNKQVDQSGLQMLRLVPAIERTRLCALLWRVKRLAAERLNTHFCGLCMRETIQLYL